MQKNFPAYKILNFKILSKTFLFDLIIIWVYSPLFVLWISRFPRHRSNFFEPCRGVFIANFKDAFTYWEIHLKVFVFMHVFNTALGSIQQTWFSIQQTVVKERFKSNGLQVFFKINVHKNFALITGKHHKGLQLH